MGKDKNMDWWLTGDQMWLDQVIEEIVEPDLPIIDPHHHLWSFFGGCEIVRLYCKSLPSGNQVDG